MTGARGEADTGNTSVLAGRRWLFGAALLDERSLALTVNGVDVELERKPLEVLLHLLHHAGEVVTKDELLAAVWPGRVLSDSALTSCMHKLRGALDDEAQNLIKTQHGYGYRLVAPVRVESAAVAAPPRFDFKAGDHPPQRPLWSLVERLGTGGHGEAWLARHDKTREARVFKFAGDGATLTSLKREITLYRLLHDSLGERRDFVRILDWNLEEAPYFIEADYTEGGSLVTWAQAQGGIGAVAQAARLELAAQIADALAAAHSVGVLHKDLKPSNVLVDSADGRPLVKLCDFGSGSVLDPQRLEQLGITRLGFTQALSPADTTSGTPLYLAPEVVAGQPFTLQSDIYSLGVLLYQLVAGDFHKPLAPGWEQNVADELLREDIAVAADGNPERRLADAAQFALRLRTLDQRRRSRSAERAARAEAAEAKLQMERMRARQTWVRLVLAASVTGVAVSSWLFVRAERAAAATQAVSDFLNNDVLSSADPWRYPTKSVTIKDALDRASEEVPRRFADRPEIAAQLHATMGAIYLRMQEYPAARIHAERAATLYTDLYGPDSTARLAVLKPLGDALLELGQVEAACSLYDEVLRRRSEGNHENPAVLRARYDTARCIARSGDFVQTRDELRNILQLAQAAADTDEELQLQVQTSLADALVQTGELVEAEQLHAAVLAQLAAQHGERHLRTTLQRENLALLLEKKGDYAQAGDQLEGALAALGDWSGETSAHSIRFLTLLGNVRMRQGRLDDAVRLLEDATRRARILYGGEHYYLAQIPAILATAYQKQGRFIEALSALRQALALSQKLFGPEHRFSIDVSLRLADCLRQQGNHAQAWAALKAVSKKGLGNLPPQHLLRARYLEQQGRLWRADGRQDLAIDAMHQALTIYERALGAAHPTTTALRSELDRGAKPRS